MTADDRVYECEERAAILEYDANMPRERAEQLAREMVYGKNDDELGEAY